MMVVVTMTRCPPKIRGDLTKWLLEIDTGVYVGSVSARVRDGLWERITSTIGTGRATMAFSTNGEQKYSFYVCNPEYAEPIDYDGIKLILRKQKVQQRSQQPDDSKPERSENRIAENLKSDKPAAGLFDNTVECPDYTVIDIETTGLNKSTDEIVEIAALRVRNAMEVETFEKLVRISSPLPQVTKEITHLSDEDINEKGIELSNALLEFEAFAGNDLLVGYNIQFDLDFLNEAAARCVCPHIENATVDVMAFARKNLKRRYRLSLSRVADDLGVQYSVRHRAVPDCRLTYQVFEKLKQM